MAGLTPMFSMGQIERYIDKFQERTEEKIIKTLQYVGEHFVTLARDRPPIESFRDITGNLRSSIGFVIVQNGEIISENFEQASSGTEGRKGIQKAKNLARILANEHNRGIVLIGMAGMEYALRVENIEGKDVISSPEVEAKEMLKKHLNND